MLGSVCIRSLLFRILENRETCRKRVFRTRTFSFSITFARNTFAPAHTRLFWSANLQGMEKIMETLNNLFVLDTLKELQLAKLNVFLPFVYTM
jgi:hypothetical protein